MKLSLLALCIFLLTPLTGTAQQIYKTTDEQGNTVFTDSPPTKDATAVQLNPSNVADSVEVRPHQASAAKPAPAKTSSVEEKTEDVRVYIEDDDDRRGDLIEARKRQEIREHITDGEHTPENLPATKPAARPLPAGVPHRSSR